MLICNHDIDISVAANLHLNGSCLHVQWVCVRAGLSDIHLNKTGGKTGYLALWQLSSIKCPYTLLAWMENIKALALAVGNCVNHNCAFPAVIVKTSKRKKSLCCCGCRTLAAQPLSDACCATWDRFLHKCRGWLLDWRSQQGPWTSGYLMVRFINSSKVKRKKKHWRRARQKRFEPKPKLNHRPVSGCWWRFSVIQVKCCIISSWNKCNNTALRKTCFVRTHNAPLIEWLPP